MGSFLAILTTVLQLVPLAETTVTGIRSLIAADPNVPSEAAAILQDTSTTNADTLAKIAAWGKANPQ